MEHQPRSEHSIDQHLAILLERVTTDLLDGKQIDFQALANSYPEYADELVQLQTTLTALADWGDGTASPAASQPSTPEIRTLGDYQLIRVLGRGGMGTVYEAHQISLDRRVAVKVLPFAALLDQRQLRRFKNEARAAAMLKHRHIVSIYSVGCERGVHYFAMELVDGQTLADIACTRPSVQSDAARAGVTPHADDLESPSAAAHGTRINDTSPAAQLSTQRSTNRKEFFRSIARLGAQAADALQYAHHEGVIHRDVKPSNMLVDEYGDLHIADFGLAQIQTSDDLTMTGDLVGTLRYMSPEQIDGTSPVDHRTDIYSLGVTLYELVAGQPCFNSPARRQALHDVAHARYTPLHRILPDVPRDFQTIIAKAMAHSVYERYVSAQELHDDLCRFIDGYPVRARRAGSIETARRWCERNRSKTALIALATMVLVTLAIGGPLLALRESRRAHEQSTLAEYRRVLLYEEEMARAHEYIEHGEVDEAVALLRKYMTDDGAERNLRSFEWYEMMERCRRRLQATSIHTSGPCRDVDVSDDGRILVSTYFERGPTVYDSTGDLLWKPSSDDKHAGHSADMVFTPDGQHIISRSYHELKVWDANDGTLLASEALPQGFGAIAVSNDGLVAVGLSSERLPTYASLDSTLIKLFRLQSNGGKVADITISGAGRLEGSLGAIDGLAFSPDGRLVAAACEDSVLRIWDIHSTQLVKSFAEHRGPLISVDFSPDGKQICAAGGVFDKTWHSGEAVVWDLETEEIRRTVYHRRPIYAAKFVDEDRLLTGGLDRVIKLTDLANNLLVEKINAHADSVRGIALFPDRKSIVSVSDDGFARIWRIEDRPDVTVVSDPGMMNTMSLAYMPDSATLVSAGSDGVRIWETVRGPSSQVLGRHKNLTHAVDVSADGKLIAAVGANYPYNSEGQVELKLWDARAQKLYVQQSLEELSFAYDVSFARSGDHLAISGYYGRHGRRLLLWDIEARRVVRSIELRNGRAAVFSRDGSLIGTVNAVWKYPSLDKVFEFDSSLGFAIDIHPNNQSIAISPNSRDILICSAHDGTVLSTLRNTGDIVLHLQYSPDGKRLVSASQNGSVIIWNLETQNEIVRYRDHEFWAWCALFSPDGRVLATCQDGRRLPPRIRFRRAISERDAHALLSDNYPKLENDL